jgi:hypothetical protein
MARALTTNRAIDAFITRVISEANHHAPEVAAIIMPLSQAVRARLTLGPDTVEVYERSGNLARTCWVTINGNRYVFKYNYETKKIELKAHSLQGVTIRDFDNATSPAAIARQAAAL